VPPITSVLPGYVAESWFVLVAPAGTPAPVIDRMSAEVDRILKKPEVVERFAKLGATPVGGTPKQLGDFIVAEPDEVGVSRAPTFARWLPRGLCLGQGPDQRSHASRRLLIEQWG
jgi:hypothetical protein